ncbi:MAG: LysR family transcriptional regulator [Pseudomonadota bacterium]
MKHHLPSLDALKVFESAGKNLSFSAAAAELCLSKGAVSYQIGKLERELGVDLFHRSIRQVWLTEAGQMLLKTTQEVFSDLSNTVQRLDTADHTNQIVIGITTYVAARWMSPRIATFNQMYPDISIRFSHTVNEKDFTLAEVDFALRWGSCNGLSAAQTLFELPQDLFVAANPDVAGTLDKTVEKQCFENVTLLDEDRDEDLWSLWARDWQLPNASYQVVADANVRVQAAIDGQGLILADDMMQNEFRNGSLVPVWAKSLTGYGYIFMRDPNRKQTATTSRFQNWMLAELERASENSTVSRWP